MGKEALGKVSPPPQPFPRPSLRFVPSAYSPQCSFPSKNKRQRKAKCLTGLAYWVSLLPPSHSFLLYLIHSLWCWRLLVCSWVFVCFSCGKLNRDPLFKQVAVMGRLPFSPKFRKFWLEIKWNGPFRFGPTGIFGTRFEGGLLWQVRSFWSIGPKCPSPFDKSVFRRTALLHPAYKTNRPL